MSAIEPNAFLEILKLEDLQPTFAENGIDAEVLAELSAEDLADLEITEEHRPRLTWGVSQVLPLNAWLSQIGMTEYLSNLVENELGMDQVSSLSKDDLIEIGIKALGHRKKILSAIEALGSANESVAPSSKSDVSNQTDSKTPAAAESTF